MSPSGTSIVTAHCTQVSTDGTPPSSARVHSPPSTCTSTWSMPVCWCQATPPNDTGPAATSSPERGTSIRDAIFTGPSADQPRVVQ